MSSDDSADKEHEPSQKRLDDARAKGQIARSTDLMTACSYGGFLLAAVAIGSRSTLSVGAIAAGLLDRADHTAAHFLGHGSTAFAGLMSSLAAPLLPLFVIPGLAALGYLLASRTLIITSDNLLPKLSRISPFSTAKQKFGSAGLFEFGKSFCKLVIISTVLTIFLLQHAQDVMATLYLTPANTSRVLMQLFVQFLTIVAIISVVIGGLDFFWQRRHHIQKNRMSRKDVMDESRDQDGDPHMKAQRRQRGYDIATNQMLADVANADVIVVNPTHFAVALKWNRAAKQAPVCLAKGTDEIAARIRERAAEAGIPIHSDPPTARALFAKVEIGQQILPEHYRAVAAAIRFAEAMRKRARKARK